MAKALIRIANPLPGGSRYTSVENAKNQERKGYADIVEGVLIFRTEVQERRSLSSAQAAQLAEDRAVTTARNSIFWWNGCKGERAAFPPFCNVSIPRPDARI